MTLSQRIDELVEQHGSLWAAARVLRVDIVYLADLRSGDKQSPSDTLLRRMGLQKEINYVRIK